MPQSRILIVPLLILSALRAAAGEEDAARHETATKASQLLKAAANAPFTSDAADTLVRELAALGRPAIPAIVGELERAAAEKSILTGALITVAVRLKAVQAAPLLLSLAREHSLAGVRADALQALGTFHQPSTVRPLLEILAAALSKKEPADADAGDRMEKVSQALIALNHNHGCAHALLTAIDADAEQASEELKLQWIYILRNGSFRSTELALLKLSQDRSNAVVAAAVQALGETGSKGIEPHLRTHLRSRERKIRIAAALASGKLKAVSAIPDLLEMLGSTEQDVPDSALWALQAVSGMRFPADRQRWQQWFDGERADALKKFAALQEDLRSNEPLRMALAMEQMATLGLLRDRLYDALQPYASHADYCVRAACCAALADSGDPRALATLAGKLQDSSTEVSFAAWRALKSATGKQYPRDHELWRAYAQRKGM